MCMNRTNVMYLWFFCQVSISQSQLTFGESRADFLFCFLNLNLCTSPKVTLKWLLMPHWYCWLLLILSGLNISWNWRVCLQEAPQWVIFWSGRDAMTRKYKTDERERKWEEEWGAEIKREEDKSEIRRSNTDDEQEAGRAMESKIDGKQRARERRGRTSQLVWLIWVSCRSLGLRPERSPTSSPTWRLCSQIHEEIHNVSERPTWRAAAVLSTPSVNTQTHTTSSNTHTHVEI